MAEQAERNGAAPLPVGSVVGILGGGQLGRMMAIAANRLGFKTVILSPRPEDPAASVAHHHICAAFDDETGLAKLAELSDIVTYELEQLPADTLRWLIARVPVAPGVRILEVAQDRVREKTFLSSVGIPTAAWRAVERKDDLLAALAEIGRPAVLKVAYGGYDGKGQAMLEQTTMDAEVLAIWDRFADGADMTVIIEEKLDFECELSVIVGRSADGDKVAYDPAFNIHKNHILDTSEVPGPFTPLVVESAKAIGFNLAEALELVGVLCIELFLLRSGELRANEIAPRPHNSGHWTLDAAHTDQFEQLVRAACGLPLGNPGRFIDARMQNIIGDDVAKVPSYLKISNAKLHLYGKRDARPGRKMGHVTFIGSTP